MKKYIVPQSKHIEIISEGHILTDSTKGTIIDNNKNNEVDADASLSKKRNPIWNASEK